MYMDGGTTTQSKFVIPILTLQNIIHNIHQRNKLANLLKVTKLTIWNKISMTHKFCFEVMDKISIIMQILHIENMLLFRKLKDSLVTLGVGKTLVMIVKAATIMT